MLTPAARDAMLAALQVASMSVHFANPGTSGANEVAGVARQPCSFGPAASGQRVLSSTVAFSIPAGTTAVFLGLWLNDGSFAGYVPLGGNERRFEVDANAITGTGLTVVDGQRVVFLGSSVPSGVTAGTPLYAVNATASSFQVSSTEGGSPLLLGDSYSEACVVSPVAVDVYGSPGTLLANAVTIRLP